MTPEQRRAVALCTHFGIPVAFYRVTAGANRRVSRHFENLIAVGAAPDGYFYTGEEIVAPEEFEAHNLLHELGHWIGATRHQRAKVNFGGEFWESSRQEIRACKVQLALEPLVGIAHEETLDRIDRYSFSRGGVRPETMLRRLQAVGWKFLGKAGCPPVLAEACVKLSDESVA
jgi:hypothetical protein